MYLYILFLILALISLIEVENISIKYNPLFYIKSYYFFIFIFILLSSLRWEVGTDWDSYYNFYTYHVNSSDIFIGNMEPGFTLMNSLNSIFNNYTIQLTSLAFLSILPIAYRIKQFSIYPFFSLFIWFSTSFAGIFSVRQNIAIALFVYSWKFIEEKKIKKYIFIIVLAATFHISVLIALPVYFIWHKKIHIYQFIILFVSASICSILLSDIISNILSSMGNEYIRAKIDYYLTDSDRTYGSAYNLQQVIYRGIINRSFLFFPLLFILNNKRKLNQRINAFLNMYFYSFILFLVVTPLSMALGRLCMYTDTAQFFIIPFIFLLKLNRFSKLLIMLFIILYLSYRFYGIIYNYEELYIPYKFVLFN